MNHVDGLQKLLAEHAGMGEAGRAEIAAEYASVDTAGLLEELSSADPEPTDDFADTTSPADLEDQLDALLGDAELPTPVVNTLDDLDALLAESTTAMRDAQAAKAARDRVKRGGLTARELAEDLERIRAWEAAHEWAAAANAIRFLQQDCECGRSHQIFTGLLRREVHRTMRFSQRWVAVPSALADLPNEVLIARAKVPLCGHCAEGKGWDVTKAMVTEA